MNTANAGFGFLGFGRGRRDRQDEDPADMGTCFGLDLSLGAAEPHRAPPATPPLAGSWWTRFAPRRRTSG